MRKKTVISNLGEVDVIYRYKKSLKNRPTVKSADDAMTIFRNLFPEGTLGLQEQFAVLYLNRSNLVIGSAILFKGGVSNTTVDMRIVVGSAVKVLSSGVIVAHNHPSGNLTPSKDDIELTKRLKECLRLMNITLLDHLIITPDFSHRSLAEQGLI